jgi:hypothetical protein
MNIEFTNYWLGNSMEDGGCFPVYLFRIDADIHPAWRFVEIIFFNFGISIEFSSGGVSNEVDK